jgi:cytochrome P450
MFVFSSSYILLPVVACLGILALGRKIVLQLQRQYEVASKHDCRPPVYEKSAFFLEIGKAIEMVRQFQNQNVLSYFLALFRHYGDTYVSKVLWLDIVVTCDPENIKQVLQHRFSDFDIGPLRRNLFLPVTPHGIFNLDGEVWRAARKMFRVQLMDTRSALNLDVLEEQVQLMLARLPREGREKIDIQEQFIALTTDFLGIFAVGKSLGMLSDHQKPKDKEVVDAFRYVKDRIARYGQSGPARWLYDSSQFSGSSSLIQKYIEGFVYEAVQKNTRNELLKEVDDSYSSFVERAVQDGNGFEEVRDQTTSIYLAGIDSLTGLLSATFWFLAQNPKSFNALRAEVLEVFGHDPPGLDELNNIVNLRYTFNEGNTNIGDSHATPIYNLM